MADPQRIPARYIGAFPVQVSGQHGPVHNADGARVDGTVIGQGDVVMMPAAEVLGQTYWHDPRQNLPSLYLGVGAVVRPEDARTATGRARTRAELQVMGYEFHSGRNDFEPVSAPPSAPQPAAPATAQPIADSIAVPDAAPVDAPADGAEAIPLTTEPVDAIPADEPAGQAPAEGV